MKTKIAAPFLSNEQIRRKTNEFRSKYWDETMPVNIEEIIEQKLEINIIPIPNLFEFCNSDALITSDWSSIYIDNKKYMDDRYNDRLRFSLAHEIGHFVLHKNIYNSFGIKDFGDFYNFFADIDPEQYSYFETQANKFASHLLIPSEKLISEKDKILKAKNMEHNNFNEDVLIPYLATELSDRFGVSNIAVECGLKRKN